MPSGLYRPTYREPSRPARIAAWTILAVAGGIIVALFAMLLVKQPLAVIIPAGAMLIAWALAVVMTPRGTGPR